MNDNIYLGPVRAWRSPQSAAIRTFLQLLAGYSTAWAGLDFVTDWRTSGSLITLNIISALLGAALAAAATLRDDQPPSAAGKAIRSFLEALIAAGATLVVANLTLESFVHFGRGLYTALAGAVVAGIVTYLQGSAEQITKGDASK